MTTLFKNAKAIVTVDGADGLGLLRIKGNVIDYIGHDDADADRIIDEDLISHPDSSIHTITSNVTRNLASAELGIVSLAYGAV